MSTKTGLRIPSSFELSRLSYPTRCIVLHAYYTALKAEEDGLNVGFLWNTSTTIAKARRSVKDRYRVLFQRAEECHVDLEAFDAWIPVEDVGAFLNDITERAAKAA